MLIQIKWSSKGYSLSALHSSSCDFIVCCWHAPSEGNRTNPSTIPQYTTSFWDFPICESSKSLKTFIQLQSLQKGIAFGDIGTFINPDSCRLAMGCTLYALTLHAPNAFARACHQACSRVWDRPWSRGMVSTVVAIRTCHQAWSGAWDRPRSRGIVSAVGAIRTHKPDCWSSHSSKVHVLQED